MYRQPNLLWQCICGIAQHSVIKHRIIVPFSDGIDMGDESDVTDWCVDIGGQAWRHFSSVREAQSPIMSYGKAEGFPIRFMDVTGDILREGKSTWAPEDGARKVNFALPKVETEWVFPFWDADYYVLPAWDFFMLRAAETTGFNGVYVPLFDLPEARPVVTGDLPEHPAVFPGWSGYLTLREIHQKYISAGPVGEDEIRRCSSWADTSQVSINPQWWRTDALGESIDLPAQGHTPEWALAKRAQDRGFDRIAHGRSRILHKYSVAT